MEFNQHFPIITYLFISYLTYFQIFRHKMLTRDKMNLRTKIEF